MFYQLCMKKKRKLRKEIYSFIFSLFFLGGNFISCLRLTISLWETPCLMHILAQKSGRMWKVRIEREIERRKRMPMGMAKDQSCEDKALKKKFSILLNCFMRKEKKTLQRCNKFYPLFLFSFLLSTFFIWQSQGNIFVVFSLCQGLFYCHSTVWLYVESSVRESEEKFNFFKK